MDNELNNIKSLAAKFLAIADELNEKVSAYLNGSTAKEAEEAYEKVIATEVEFTKAADAVLAAFKDYASNRDRINKDLATTRECVIETIKEFNHED